MATTPSGIKAHDDACIKAEAVRQAAVTPGASQATIRAAEISYFRTCLASAKTNGLSTAVFATALRELGVNS